jgi:hypothetical protein
MDETSIAAGATTLLAVVFLVAAVMKLRWSRQVEVTLVRLFPAAFSRQALVSSRGAVKGVVALELGLGIALCLSSGALATVVRAATAAILLGFVMVVQRARARGTGCACFGAPTGRAAEAADLLRTSLLALVAIATALAPASDIAVRQLDPAAVAAAAVLWLSTFGLARLLRHSSAMAAESASDAGGGNGSGGPAISRRTALTRAMAIALGAAFLSRIDTEALANTHPPRSCQDQFNLCYGCGFPGQVNCCKDCYVTCQLGGACVAGLSCGGCWPGP